MSGGTEHDVVLSQIQKIWRGYWSRKKVFDFYGRKKYFHELEWKTELMRHVYPTLFYLNIVAYSML